MVRAQLAHILPSQRGWNQTHTLTLSLSYRPSFPFPTPTTLLQSPCPILWWHEWPQTNILFRCNWRFGERAKESIATEPLSPGSWTFPSGYQVAYEHTPTGLRLLNWNLFDTNTTRTPVIGNDKPQVIRPTRLGSSSTRSQQFLCSKSINRRESSSGRKNVPGCVDRPVIADAKYLFVIFNPNNFFKILTEQCGLHFLKTMEDSAYNKKLKSS